MNDQRYTSKSNYCWAISWYYCDLLKDFNSWYALLCVFDNCMYCYSRCTYTGYTIPNEAVRSWYNQTLGEVSIISNILFIAFVYHVQYTKTYGVTITRDYKPRENIPKWLPDLTAVCNVPYQSVPKYIYFSFLTIIVVIHWSVYQAWNAWDHYMFHFILSFLIRILLLIYYFLFSLIILHLFTLFFLFHLDLLRWFNSLTLHSLFQTTICLYHRRINISFTLSFYFLSFNIELFDFTPLSFFLTNFNIFFFTLFFDFRCKFLHNLAFFFLFLCYFRRVALDYFLFVRIMSFSNHSL